MAVQPVERVAVEAPAPGQLEQTLERQRRAFLAEMPVGTAVRRDRLRRASAMVLAHRRALHDALMQDFGSRSAEWTWIAEFFTTLQALRAAEKSVHRWMRPERRRAPMPFRLFGAHAQIQYQPLGVVGIMGAWNGPLNLVLAPLAPVLAAGNRAMLCPSDQMPAVAAALDAAVSDYFAPEELAVVRGGLSACQAFSQLPFDHLMFTGSSRVGALVMGAAAKNLTPVTLELGGKCPAIIAPDADLADAARRIVGGKTLNGGQACVAPDLLMVPRALVDRFAAQLDAAFRELYPGGIRTPAYCGLVNAHQYERLGGVVAEAGARGARIVALGQGGADAADARDATARRLALHLLIDPPDDTRAMTEELFGPVFSLVGYDDVEVMCARVRAMPKPLGLYVFSRSQRFAQDVLDRTFSGGVTLNDVMFHYSVADLPFGGVGNSGIGAYSAGIDGFRRFSHARSVYRQAGPRSLLRVMHPPYTRLYDWVIRRQIERMAHRYQGIGARRAAP